MVVSDTWSLLSFIVVGALIDSIDPCIYALYISLLTPAIVNIRRCTAIATTFITSVFLGYLLFNAVLRFVLSVSTPPRWILSLALVVYALALIVYTLLFEGRGAYEVCREDRVLCKTIGMLDIGKASLSIIGVAALGIVASFTVLPCSAGMAIAFNIVTLSFGLATWIPLAILYTAIFVLPLVALTLIVVGLAKVRMVYESLLERQKYVKIGGAMIMICLALWIAVYGA